MSPSTYIQTVFDEMMVEQTDLVRLRLVRMSNVPDTLYMVNNAVPQCCHMISHQQMASTSAAAPSVVANEIPGETVFKRHLMMMMMKNIRHSLPKMLYGPHFLGCDKYYNMYLAVFKFFYLPKSQLVFKQQKKMNM